MSPEAAAKATPEAEAAEPAEAAALSDADRAALTVPFAEALVTLIRADDQFGRLEGKPPEDLLGRYVLTKEKRRKLPLLGNPTPAQLGRLSLFYRAVCLRVERRTGITATPVMDLHPEGFGRVVIVAGRLVALSRTLRDLHRFGFDSLSRLAEAGETMVDEAVAAIDRYPEPARA
jgi:probable nitrogen fixation protein